MGLLFLMVQEGLSIETERSKRVNHVTACQDGGTASSNILGSMLGGLQEG